MMSNAYYYGVPGMMAVAPAPAPAPAPDPAPASAPAPVLGATAGTYENPHLWYGNTTEEVDRENLVIAQNCGATKPANLAPVGATNDQMWWCREVDGSYTLRSTNTIQQALQPGYWAYASHGGYPYFIRQKAP